MIEETKGILTGNLKQSKKGGEAPANGWEGTQGKGAGEVLSSRTTPQVQSVKGTIGQVEKIGGKYVERPIPRVIKKKVGKNRNFAVNDKGERSPKDPLSKVQTIWGES